MRETEKIIFHDRDVAAVANVPKIGALTLAAILLALFALARGAFAISAFGVALLMLAATLRPSSRVAQLRQRDLAEPAPPVGRCRSALSPGSSLRNSGVMFDRALSKIFWN